MKVFRQSVKFVALYALALLPFGSSLLGGNLPTINATTRSGIVSASPNNQEILWEHKVVRAAFQQSVFADNMSGAMGSGKPIIIKNDTTKVAGQNIVIPTLESLGSDGVQGGGERVGYEEILNPGDFTLKVDLKWFGLGIQNIAKAQTIVGEGWDDYAGDLLAQRLSKKQTDDNLMVMRGSATSFNTVYANGKTLDTLLSTDSFGTSLVVSGGGLLKDNGALPMNIQKGVALGATPPPPILRYLMFTTDSNARPIKTDSTYLQGITHGQTRGDDNNLFTGEVQPWDGHVIYNWQNIRHGATGSIGSALQPEAKLGIAIVAKGTSNAIPGGASTVTAGGIRGGGDATKGALTNIGYFEFFSLATYLPINGVTVTIGTGTRYFAVIDPANGNAVSFFSYTANNAHTLGAVNVLSGITRLGSTITGDYNTTVGGVTWNTGAWTTAGDGAGYAGVTEGAISTGALIVETNSKGVALGECLGMGEMALVAGYGRIPLARGGFKTMANRTEWIEPHGSAFANGIEVAYGAAAFKRPDGATPNYVRMVFARIVPGMPIVTA